MGDYFDKIVLLLKNHGEHGLTLMELMAISGLSHSAVLRVFEELEDKGKLLVRSDGLSRIYRVK